MDTNKSRHTIWLNDDTWQQVRELYHKDNCTTQNEFVERALRFYAGYLKAQETNGFLPEVLGVTLNGALDSFMDHLGRILFKQAVELNVCSHIITTDTGIDYRTYQAMRDKSVREVKKTNGRISFGDKLRSGYSE